jgi:CBS domain containing-hemolysin-like protein
VSDITLLVTAFVLVALAGVLVAAETALARVSKVTIEQLKKDGNRRSVVLFSMLDDRAKYVNALLFARLSLSTVSIIFVTDAVSGLVGAGPTAVLISAAIMIVVGYVLLGVAPQTVGRQSPEKIALATVRLTKIVTIFLDPLSRLFIALGNAITPGKGFREGPFSTQAELRELVDLAGADSVIEDDERQMIHSVFELGDTIAREVMVPRTEMVWIESTKTLRQAMSLGLRSGYSRIPVVGESIDDIVGVIYLKDIARRIFEHSESQTSERVSDLMRSAYLVPDSRSVDELLRDMQSARTHLAVLVDEYGGTAGLATIEDVLEEIVGEISDEYDVAPPDVEDLGNGEYRVSSRLHIDDLADLIETELDEDGVDTVAGFMAKRLGIVPIPGAQVEIGGYLLTAESAVGRRNRISTVLVARDTFSEDEVEDLNDQLDS